MRVLSTTPVLLTLMLAMSSVQGQNTPAASTAPPAAAKPADTKVNPASAANSATATTPAPVAAKPADGKNTDPKAQPAAAKPVTAADAKKPPETANKTVAAPPATPTKNDANKTPPTAPDSAAKSADADAAKPAKPEGPPCVVAEFRAIGMDVQDVIKRRAQAQTWLKQRAKQCSVEQLLMIRNNRSQWMGTADSAGLAVIVDSLLEAIAAENPRVAALLYGTPPPPPPPGGEDKK